MNKSRHAIRTHPLRTSGKYLPPQLFSSIIIGEGLPEKENLLFYVFVSGIIESYNFLTGGTHMAISYNKLWKLLTDRKMSKVDLQHAMGIALNTMTKLNRKTLR